MSKNENLLTAVRAGNFKKVKNLLNPKLFGLSKGANVNEKNEDGYTPLLIAALHGYKDIAILLIEKGVDVNLKHNNYGAPLHYAIQNGHKDIADILVKKGADVNTKNEKGLTPLHLAALNGHKDIAVLLFEKGVGVNTKDNNGYTALYYAIDNRCQDIAIYLIENGFDIHNKTKDDNTILHDAVEKGFTKIATLVIERGADVNAKNNNNSTPLHRAAEYELKDMVVLLIKNGADVNAKEHSGRTALHKAILTNKEKEIISILIENGADVNVKDKFGQTPLHYASEYSGKKIIVDVLIENGAIVNHKDKDGLTPLDKAYSKGFSDIASLLKQHGAKVSSLKTQSKTDKRNAFPAHPSACLSINLKESSSLGPAGSGGERFQDAISCLNNKNDNQAVVYFKEALAQGLDILRQGYVHSKLGQIYLRSNDIEKGMDEFNTVLNNSEALYESVHDAAQYLCVIYQELGKNGIVDILEQLKKKTMSKINYSLSPDTVSRIRELTKNNKTRIP